MSQIQHPPFLSRTPFSSTTNDFYQQIYEMHSPLLGPISFIFMQFSEKIGQKIGWHSHLVSSHPLHLGVLDVLK